MIWNENQEWFGKQLDENIKALNNGDFSRIPWVFCVFSESHSPSKASASRALSDALSKLQFDDIIRIDAQMRQTTSMEWNINWRELKVENFLTPTMSIDDQRAVIIFASFNPNGFIREQAVRMMAKYSETLPYIILRQNDWVTQVQEAAIKAFYERMQKSSGGEILNALPFIEKLSLGNRGPHEGYIKNFFDKLTSPEHRSDLLIGLQSENIRTRKICVKVLLNSPHPDFEQVLRVLKREPDPFLRKTIYEKLCLLGQDMIEYSHIFLRDKYPVSRILALRYLYGVNRQDVLPLAKKMLLDKNALVRKLSRKIVQECEKDFKIKSFYLEHIESDTVAAILGLGEIGQKEDANIVEKYLDDTQIAVVRATMISLMRLDSRNFSPHIIEMLSDARMGVVKTAQHLIVKYGVADYKRIYEMFFSTDYNHVKIRCATILFGAPKWQSIIYMLLALDCEMEDVQKSTIKAIDKWLLKFNKSFTEPTSQQKEIAYNLVSSYDEYLTASVKKELLFILR